MSTRTPDLLPMLARGKHRNPRRGACFMELASYLAGERWSDRPACTHPLLAHLARLVNDLTSDAARPRLAVLVPAVIGLASSSPRWQDEITIVVAARALPIVPEPSQRAMAVGLLSCERLRVRRGGDPREPMHPVAAEALAQVPLAHRWASDFVGSMGLPGKHHPGTHMLECAALGISTGAVPDPDAELHDLLAAAVARCEELAGRDDEPVALPDAWREVCQPA